MTITWVKRMGKTALAGAVALAMLAPATLCGTVWAEDTPDKAVKLAGDVNGDGVVDTGDTRLLLQIAAELTALDPLSSLDTAMADVNGDGVIDTGDARLALQIAAELADPVPCPEVACPDAVVLRGYKALDNYILREATQIDSMRTHCVGDTAVLDRFDGDFFEKHDLLVISPKLQTAGIYADSLTLRQVVQNGSQLCVYLSYTETFEYRLAGTCSRDSVLLIPVEKQAADATMTVDYTYELGISDTVYPDSFIQISNNVTVNFEYLETALYTAQNREEVERLASSWCSTDNRTDIYQMFLQLHDDTFYQNNATLLLVGTEYENYSFAGFRDNEDGTRTMLFNQYYSKAADDFKPAGTPPFPFMLAVDIPKAVLAEHPVTGFERAEFIQAGQW